VSLFSRDPLARPERLIERVYAYASYRLGPGPDAEDVTSEVFERALRYRSTYDATRSEPVTWLLGIARNCIADAARSRHEAAVGEPPDLASPDDLEERTAVRLDLAAAVGRLAERDRELLALRYGADLTVRQIAELLDERTNTIEVALHRALVLLRGLVDDDGRGSVRKREARPVSKGTKGNEPSTGELA